MAFPAHQKIPILLTVCLLCSCNQPATKPDNTAANRQDSTVLVPEDPIASQIRPVLVINMTSEIQMGGYLLSRLDVDSIRYTKISMKGYFQQMSADLHAEMHLSTDKEKTQHAITYLDKQAAKSSTVPEVYEVHFHLNAQAGKIIYNEGHVKYLDKDFHELKKDFRNI